MAKLYMFHVEVPLKVDRNRRLLVVADTHENALRAAFPDHKSNETRGQANWKVYQLEEEIPSTWPGDWPESSLGHEIIVEKLKSVLVADEVIKAHE